MKQARSRIQKKSDAMTGKPFTRRRFVVGLGAGAFVLVVAPSSLKAEMSISLDVATAIKDLVIKQLDRADKREERRLKSSAASVSARMSLIAAMKQEFAEFLTGKPANIVDFPPRERETARRELRKIDREIGRLQANLESIDPDWAAKDPKLCNRLFRIGHAKGLSWAAEYGPHGSGVQTDELRAWLLEEAKKLNEGAAAITAKLSS